MPFFFSILTCSVAPIWQRPKGHLNWHLVACQTPARSLRDCYSFLHLLIFITFVKGHRWKVVVSLRRSYSSGADTACRAWRSTPWMSDVAADYSGSHCLFFSLPVLLSVIFWTLHSGPLQRQTKRSRSRRYVIWLTVTVYSQRLWSQRRVTNT